MAYKRVCDTCDSTMQQGQNAIKVQVPKALPQELLDRGVSFEEAAQMDAVKQSMGVPASQMFTLSVREFCKPACAMAFLMLMGTEVEIGDTDGSN